MSLTSCSESFACRLLMPQAELVQRMTFDNPRDFFAQSEKFKTSV